MISRIWHLVNGIDIWVKYEYLDFNIGDKGLQ